MDGYRSATAGHTAVSHSAPAVPVAKRFRWLLISCGYAMPLFMYRPHCLRIDRFRARPTISSSTYARAALCFGPLRMPFLNSTK